LALSIDDDPDAVALAAMSGLSVARSNWPTSNRRHLGDCVVKQIN
jgi:hypothetical protein